MRPFSSSAQGYVARLDEAERQILARCADDVAALVGPYAGSTPTRGWAPDGWRDAPGRPDLPGDPAVRRLLPDASDDDEVAVEFRRLATTDIVERKVVGLRLLAKALRAGSRVTVPREHANAVAGALTDIRLVLAERLGAETDADVEALYTEISRPARGDEGARRRHTVAVFLLAGMLQESLVDGMLADLRGGRPQ